MTTVERDIPNWAKGRCENAWRRYAKIVDQADDLVARNKRSLSERDQHEIRMLATHGWCKGQDSETEIQRSALARGGLSALLNELQPDVAYAFISPLKAALEEAEKADKYHTNEGYSVLRDAVKKIVADGWK